MKFRTIFIIMLILGTIDASLTFLFLESPENELNPAAQTVVKNFGKEGFAIAALLRGIFLISIYKIRRKFPTINFLLPYLTVYMISGSFFGSMSWIIPRLFHVPFGVIFYNQLVLINFCVVGMAIITGFMNNFIEDNGGKTYFRGYKSL